MSDETTDEPSEYRPPEYPPSEYRVDDPAADSTAVPMGADTEADVHAETDAGRDTEAESRAQAARRIAWAPRTRIAVASLALVAMMFVFVFPTRSYLAQRRQVGRAAHAVAVLEAQNQVLARQASRLKTRSEIERLAREQFNMVMPGEQAYNVVETPSSSDNTTTTTVP